MDVTFADLKRKIIRALSDEVLEVGSGDALIGGNTYSAEILMDSIHAALIAISSRIWKPSTFNIAGALDTSILPSDLIEVESVYDKTLGVLLPKLGLWVGENFTSSIGTGWTLFPSGNITFMNPLGSNGCTIYYSAEWDTPIADEDLVESPKQTLVCLILYAASYCLLVTAVASGNLANYKTKVDSGQPTDNPAKDMSNFMLQRYEIELQRLPMMEKGRTQ